MKKNIIIVTVLVVVCALFSVNLYNYTKDAKLEHKKWAEISKLQELNVDIKSDDVLECEVLAGDYGDFRCDGNALIRYKLKSSSSLDKIFKKQSSLKKTDINNQVERKSMVPVDDIKNIILNLEKTGEIDKEMKDTINKEKFISEDNDYAYEKVFEENIDYKKGIISYNNKNNEILLYFDRI